MNSEDLGWIKLHRRLQKSKMYKKLNSKQRDVMIQLLLLSDFQANEWEWKGQTYKTLPGQFVTSLDSIKKVCASDVSIRNIRTSIKKLTTWKFITSESTKTGRLITILNWDTYQGGFDEGDKEVTKTRQTGDKEVTGNKKGKKGKNVNKSLCPEEFPVTTKMKTYAKTKKFFLDLEDLTEGFLIHHRSKGSKFVCWYSAWQKWLRNDMIFYPDKHIQPQIQAKSQEREERPVLSKEQMAESKRLIDEFRSKSNFTKDVEVVPERNTE